MVSHNISNEQAYFIQLGAEVLFTGLTAIPVLHLSSRLTKSPRAVAFIGAAAYHLIAEGAGLNEWYIFHGAAALRNQFKFNTARNKKEAMSSKGCQYLQSPQSSLVRWPSSHTKPTTGFTLVKSALVK